MGYRIVKTEQEWREILGDGAYGVLRKKGTERPFTGIYNNHFERGLYVCRGCGHQLFHADAKFNSGCGWPSFDSELPEANVEPIPCEQFVNA
jgi:peptide-methionine (R)-S-oxide reductase